ncbi:Protein phtf [Halotydeus destructor]|nr:Protein phtf [Halotydeus destructor]
MVGQRGVDSLGTAISWYQKKIGSYDQQLWEKSIEERVLKGLSHAIPKKVTRVKTDLIDLDLIRGSTFTKAKPQESCFVSTYLGIVRVILFPFYLKWWSDQTSKLVTAILFGLYALQASSMYIYFKGDFDEELDSIPTSEVLTPLIMFFVLASVQSQIASSHHKSRPESRVHFSSDILKSSKRLPKKSPKRKNGPKAEEPVIAPEVEAPGHPEVAVNGQPKKVSDEESGLDVKMVNLSPPRKRSVSMTTQSTVKPLRERNESGEEGDEEGGEVEDGSSPDDISPYSTVNSVAGDGSSWRRYSDMVAHRVRSMSYSAIQQRFSMTDENIAPIKVSSKFLTVEEHSRPRPKKKCTKFSLRVNTSAAKEVKGGIETSGDSEDSLSPTSPNQNGGLTTDMDWPNENSDGTSEEEDEDDGSHVTARAASKMNDYFSFDPDQIPPVLASHDDTVHGNSGRTSDDKSDKVSCAIWIGNECQKVDLSVLDISSSIIRKVDRVKHSLEYFYLALVFSVALALVPGLYRLQNQMNAMDSSPSPTAANGQLPASFIVNDTSVPGSMAQSTATASFELFDTIMNQIPVPGVSLLAESFLNSSATPWVQLVVTIGIIERFALSALFFFVLCVAERTYKERFLLSKYFCHLTSSRRAHRYDLPHFRLNKVRNIKTWLSVRSYIRKHGPQRSVNVIVSASFLLAVVFFTFLCMHLLRETNEPSSSNLYCWEMLSWNLALGIFIMRLIILGSKMNLKYKGNLSVLIAEQINLYLQLEQKPHKKEELNLANHVLKLAADLLKQLETPLRISGFNANHYFYNITKVVVLSAFSALLTEMLGFKLKLHKIMKL